MVLRVEQVHADTLAVCINQSIAADGGCASYNNASVACQNALLAGGGSGAAAIQLCSYNTYGDLQTYGWHSAQSSAGFKPMGGSMMAAETRRRMVAPWTVVRRTAGRTGIDLAGEPTRALSEPNLR